MADEREDFWPKEIADVADPEPVAILKEQADLLGRKTNNDVVGIVRAGADGEKIIHSLYLKAEALGDYRYKILSMTHLLGATDPSYPVWGQAPAGHPPVELPDRAAFLAWLRGQLSSEHVRRVIANILHVIREADRSEQARAIKDALIETTTARRSSSTG